MFDFSGKNALVTGAASGIGKATAKYFHACGANVVMADINDAALEDAIRQHAPSGDRLSAVRYDAADPLCADAAIEHASRQFGNIDYLVACAGVYEDQIADEMTDAQWRRMIGINLDGVFYITRRAIPIMREGGAIVTLASTAAHQGGSHSHSHYGATKGGVLAYSRGLAKDLAPRIRVNSVSPSNIETPMNAGLLARGGDAYKARIPLGRYGKPSEAASVIAFLCSDAASFVTGETIIISGGFYMA